jgi:hypothetical protein
MSDEKDKKVITPGGPRAADLVHKVEQGEAVHVDQAGRASVLSGQDAADKSAHAQGERRHDEGDLAKSLGRAVRLSDVPASAGLVVTPGGFRHSSQVHRVQPGEALHVEPGRALLRNLANNSARELPLSAPAAVLPALGSGWITYAYWNNGTGRTLTSFRTTWQVPPAPASQGGQTIFLFNGIQNNGQNFGILQPVLQWGPSAAGGGQFWAIASWYVTSGGQAFHTPLIRVNPGDTLVGLMRLTGQAGGLFSYTSEFEGVAGTSLPVLNIAELVWCNETLEAYTINQCSDYPATSSTGMRSIRIETGGTLPTLNWTPVNAVTDCGQHTNVVSNNNGGGEVDLFYNRGVGYIADKVTLGDTAFGAPALAAAGAVVALGWTGTDPQHHLNVMTSADGRNFGGKVTLGDTSIDGPALAYGGGRLFLGWAGTDAQHHLNVMSSADNHNFGNKVTLGDTSPFAPALAYGNGRLYLAWTGSDPQHHLNVMSSTDGVHWGNKVTLGDTSASGPGLSFIDGRLYILWCGTDADHRLNVMDSADGVTFTNKVTLGDTSNFHPALAKSGPLLLSWTGRDAQAHLNVLSSTSGTHGFGNKIVEGDLGAAAPALAAFQNRPLIAWTGTDPQHHLNVARLTT